MTLEEKLAALDPTLDLFAEIDRLRRERRAIILSHYYMEPDLQDIADVLGDSLELARQAQSTDAEVIVLCGVHFMAETAKILNPHKTVLIPDLEAGCSLADSCKPEELAALKAKHPDHLVVSYVNTTAAIKALSDWCCTSSNAVKVVEAIPRDQPIIFAPDVNLGRWVKEQSGRDDIILWPGTCVVHETFNERHVLKLLEENPGAQLIAHPECEPPILKHAEVIGSTKKLLGHTRESDRDTFVVATEHGIIHAMQKASPDKTFIPAAPHREGDDPTCGCSICPYMKLHTLEKVYLCLRDLEPTVELDEELRVAALKPIERMVSVG